MNSPFPSLHSEYYRFAILETELRTGLDHYWNEAAKLLDGGPVRLIPPSSEDFSLARNFFSILFLYSYYRAGIEAERRILYVAINQCLRGMVTGCDNILDNEYKRTIETDLPAGAHRFRSVLDIMASDRILFALVARYCEQHDLTLGKALAASSASLRSLLKSGVQEASEEGGVDELLTPDDVLQKVHHYKTGLLFTCTWAIPELLEPELTPAMSDLQQALYRVGIGCQILDDIVDLKGDFLDKRHNYVASALAYRAEEDQWRQVKQLLADESEKRPWTSAFPDLATQLRKEAVHILETGLRCLFSEEHQGFIWPAILFMADRIGVVVERTDASY